MNITQLFNRPASALSATALTVLLSSCSSTSSTPPPSLNRLAGASALLGAGTASTFVTTDGLGRAVAMGLTFNDAALTNLGDDMSMTVLPLPKVATLPFQTVVINWNPHGHPPAHIYDVPHFDLHFYSIDEQTRLAISPALPQASVKPAAPLVPAGYIADPGGVVPQMGLHYVPVYQPEFHGLPFTATPIYGYWNGHDAFVEGMVTKAFLDGHPALTQPLHLPAVADPSGVYPSAWHIAYDGPAHLYTVTFDGFTQR